MRPATLRDVALRAGVSIRTVSNVVNDYARVAPETRDRVQAVIDELGYRPNLLARNLKQGRSQIIAVAVPELHVPYFAELVRLIIAEGRRRGYLVLVDDTDGNDAQERSYLGEAHPLNVDGIILSPLALTDADVAGRASRTPLVLLGERVSGAAADLVAIDNVAAAASATRHLIDRGRRRVAAIGVHPATGTGTADLRLEGFRRAHRDTGLPIDDSLLASTPRFHRDHGAEAMARLLDRPDRPDAVFCFTDLLALGAIRAALDRGLRVPEDLAVAGFDDIEDGRFSTPSLTTISPDKAAIAVAAVDRVVDRVESGEPAAPVTVTAPFRLVVRESTAGRGAA